MWFLALFIAQDAQSQAERVRAAMQPAIEQQRASVRKQVESVGVKTDWTMPAIPGFAVPPPACDPVPAAELNPMIDEAARKHELDPSVVRAVAKVESGFRPCAVSAKGAEGLMQLMPATQSLFQVQNPFSAQQSLEAGSSFLKTLLDKYHGDLSLALSAYNAGPGTVDRAGGIPEIPETQAYVAEILKQLLPGGQAASAAPTVPAPPTVPAAPTVPVPPTVPAPDPAH